MPPAPGRPALHQNPSGSQMAVPWIPGRPPPSRQQNLLWAGALILWSPPRPPAPGQPAALRENGRTQRAAPQLPGSPGRPPLSLWQNIPWTGALNLARPPTPPAPGRPAPLRWAGGRKGPACHCHHRGSGRPSLSLWQSLTRVGAQASWRPMGCFPLLTIVNDAAMDTGVQISL